MARIERYSQDYECILFDVQAQIDEFKSLLAIPYNIPDCQRDKLSDNFKLDSQAMQVT